MDVSVNSTIIQVSSRKKGSPLLCWQSPIDGKDDLLDLLISRIKTQLYFNSRSSDLAMVLLLHLKQVQQSQSKKVKTHVFLRSLTKRY